MGFLYDILEKTNKVYDTLDKEYSSLPIAQEAKYELNRFVLASDYFDVDIYFNKTWLEKNNDFKTFFFNFYEAREATCKYLYFRVNNEESLSDTVNKYVPLVCVVLASDLLFADTGTLAQLRFNSASYLFMIIINDGLPEAELDKFKYNCNGKIVSVPISSFPVNDFVNIVESKVFSRDKMKEMQTLFALKTVRPYLQEVYFRIMSDRERIDELLLKKEELREAKDTYSNGSASIDSANKLKIEMQREFREIDKEMKSKYAEFGLPNRGLYAKLNGSIVSQLKSLDVKESNDRYPKMLTSIPAQYIDFAERNLRNLLEKSFREDHMEIDKKLARIKSKLDASQLPVSPMPLNKNDSFPNAGKIIDAFVNLTYSKTYSGEIPKMTIQTYLMQVRQQTIFIFIIMSLINPLLQAPKLFFRSYFTFDPKNDTPDLQAIKVIRTQNYDDFLIWFSVIIGLATVGLSIYYLIELRKKIPLMKEEMMSKELEKVKTGARSEGARILSDASREWQNSINTWLNESLEGTNIEIDKTVTENNKNRAEDNAQAEKNYQVAVNDYNTRNQKYLNAEKLMAGIINEHYNLISSLETKVNFYLTNK
jgi:hypothetical protein